MPVDPLDPPDHVERPDPRAQLVPQVDRENKGREEAMVNPVNREREERRENEDPLVCWMDK